MATNGHSPRDVVPNPGLYDTLQYCGDAVVALFLFIGIVTWNILLFEGMGLTFNSGPTAILAAIAYLIFSFKEVGADEVGAAFSYGKALIVLSSGPRFIPFGLMQIRKGPRLVQEFQCPGEPEKVFKDDDKKDLPPGMVRPIRVVTGGPTPATDKDDVLNARMTLIINFYVQWNITDVLDYASNYGSSEEVEKQVRDIGEGVLTEIAIGYSAASYIDNLLNINQRLTDAIQKRFENSGVDIISTRQISPDVSHELSSALLAIPKAKADAAKVVIEADAENHRLTKVGAGKAAAELAMLHARADGQKKMIDQLGISGETIVAAEAVRALSDKTDVLVAGAEGGMRDMMGLVKGAQSALKPKGGDKS